MVQHSSKLHFWHQCMLSYKCANGCRDKLREAMRLEIPILTFWSGTDEGKCEVDSRGRDFADKHRNIPDSIVSRGGDPEDFHEISDEINNNHSTFPKADKRYLRCNIRHCEVIEVKDLEEMRKKLPRTDTLVIKSPFDLEYSFNFRKLLYLLSFTWHLSQINYIPLFRKFLKIWCFFRCGRRA